MPRESAYSTENSFANGLVTEATSLNFPENACTEIYDCVIEHDGSVHRRLGFDFEIGNDTKNVNRNEKAVKTYLWKNVAGNGDVSLLVKQVGDTIYFYRTSSASLSGGAVSSTVTLTPVSGADDSSVVEADFTDGNGYLIVTHPFCEPFRVTYDVDTDTATQTDITIKIRDFEGVEDFYAIDERPVTNMAGLSNTHKYNLFNQGWVLVRLNQWDSSQSSLPSNVDVMWRFKDANGFDFNSVDKIASGNTPAPKGHYILTLSDQDRNTASGLTGLTSTTTGTARPSTCSFFAGRSFYAGINKAGFNSKIYFTQIIERDEQYGFCYQVNDPTSESLFDLLPSDGGVISIPDAGTILKLAAIPGGLAVFAVNGIWFVTGSTGIGFTATDYTVQKISSVTCLSASSFVDAAGNITWWNAEGIWTIVAEGNLPAVKSLTDQKIATFYDEIPLSSKRFARGFYNNVAGVIRWLYRSTSTGDLNEVYEFDRVLTFNTRLGSFYAWRITNSDVKVHGIVVSDGLAGAVTAEPVVDGLSAAVVDSLGNPVYIYTSTGTSPEPTEKYLVSYAVGNSDLFTFAEVRNSDYIDWFQYDNQGESFTSYFITGYKLRGKGINKWQSCWTSVHSKTIEPVSYYFQGVWDFATTPSGTGRWSVKQYINHPEPDYAYAVRKLKVRGQGLSLQFRVASVPGEPFNIIGWSSLNTANQVP